MSAKENLFKSKIREVKQILCDPIINRDKKIEEIKVTLYDTKNNLFKPEKDNYKQVRDGNGFSSNYIEYKSNGEKDKTLSIKDNLDEIKPYLSEWRTHTQGEWKIHLTITINLFFRGFLRNLYYVQ